MLGSVRVEARYSVSVENGSCGFRQSSSMDGFPTMSREAGPGIVTPHHRGIPEHDRVIALDRVLANIDTSQIIPKNVEGVKADPPTIFYSTTPAVLVNLDGDPIWSPIKDNDLKFAVNTNWDLFQHEPTKTLLPAQRRRAG